MAIKIIKPGEKPDTTKRFTCEQCGYVFEADEDDYEVGFDPLYGDYCYMIECPTCGCATRIPYDEEDDCASCSVITKEEKIDYEH